MKNINEGIFDLIKKDKPSTGAITADDAKPKKTDDTKKSKDVAVLRTYKIEYLKRAAIFINAFNKTDGEDDERILDKTVVAYKKNLIETADVINKKSANSGFKIQEHWTNLFNSIKGFNGDIGKVIELYNTAVENSKYKNIQKISTDKPENKTNSDKPENKTSGDKQTNRAMEWAKLLNNPDELDKIASPFAKELKRFTEIFGINESFIYRMIEELDWSGEEDNFEKAIEFITLIKTGETDVGKVLKAWAETNKEKYRDKVNKYYEKIKDEEKKQRFKATVEGKGKSDTSKKPTDITTKDAEPETDDEDDEKLTLNKTKFVNGMKKISENPERFRKINTEILKASPGSTAYLDWNDFKKILAYIQDPDSAEEENVRDAGTVKRDLSRVGREES